MIVYFAKFNAGPEILNIVCGGMEYYGVACDLHFNHIAVPYCVLTCSAVLRCSIHLVVLSTCTVCKHGLNFARSCSYMPARRQ